MAASAAGLVTVQPQRAKIRAHEHVQALHLEAAAQFRQSAGDQAQVRRADDLRMRLREIVEGTTPHVHPAPVYLGSKPQLVEEPHDLADRLLLIDTGERGWAADKAATPGATGLLRPRPSVVPERDGAGQDGREETVLVTARDRRSRLERVENTRPSRRDTVRCPPGDDSGVAE